MAVGAERHDPGEPERVARRVRRGRAPGVVGGDPRERRRLDREVASALAPYRWAAVRTARRSALDAAIRCPGAAASGRSETESPWNDPSGQSITRTPSPRTGAPAAVRDHWTDQPDESGRTAAAPETPTPAARTNAAAPRAAASRATGRADDPCQPSATAITTRPSVPNRAIATARPRSIVGDDLVVDPVLEPVVEPLDGPVAGGEPEGPGEAGGAVEGPAGIGGAERDRPRRGLPSDEGIGGLRAAGGADAHEAHADGGEDEEAGGNVRSHRSPPSCTSGRSSTARPPRTSGTCPTSRRRSSGR